MKAKTQVASLSVATNSLLIALKLCVGLASGSVSIISEAIHSSMDLVAAAIALFSVSVSDKPPDKEHPYGHGKIENVSGAIEALLILVAAGFIIWEATRKLLGREGAVEQIWLGSLVMFVSAAVNLAVSHKLYTVARKTNSVALEADALHLRTDVYTSLGVAVGLLLIAATGIAWVDPLVAIAVALFIVKESFTLLLRAFSPLLDSAWAEGEVGELERILQQLRVEYHDLRTRIAGNRRFVDFHLTVAGDQSVHEAHEYCDEIENKLKELYDNLNVTIHVEPQYGPTESGLPIRS